MSNRSKRRSSASRRTPQRASGGMQIPWVPAGIAAGVVAVVVVIVIVVLQAGGSSNDYGPAVAAEADQSDSLPGQWVDLASIYKKGPYPGTAGHVTVAQDYAADGNSNPPAGGPHWSGNCGTDPKAAPPFCGPAPIGIYRDPWSPETLVHNMEHGGVVVWYNFDDTALRDQLEAIVTDHLEKDQPVTMAPYPDMEPDTIALTSWSRIDKFPASDFTKERVDTFIDTHQRRFNPEHF